MSTNPIWIAGYGGPIAGASPKWIASYGVAVSGATESWIAGYGGTPTGGASPVWIAGYGGAPAAAGASPIWIGGYITGSGGGTVVSSTWSAADATANSMTLTNGGLTVTQPNAAWGSIRGSTSHATGKYYVEFKAGSSSSGSVAIGFANAGFVATNYLSTSIYSEGSSLAGGGTVASAGFVVNTASGAYAPALGDVFQLAVDFDAGKIWFGLNNTTWPTTGNPAAGTAPWVTIVAPALGLAFYPAISLNASTAGSWILHSTAASQTYAAPSGFTAWDAP